MAEMKQKNKGLFIVFEGLDEAGKTTCAKGVIEKLKGKYEFCYSKCIGSETIIGRLARKYPSTFLFCLELIFITLFEIKQSLKRGKIVLQDRYNFTIASHLPNIERKTDQLLIKLFSPFFRNPDLIIYFTVSLDKRIERLKATMKNNKYHRILVKNPELILSREKKYRQLLTPYKNRLIIIDTSDEKKEKTIDQLAIAINNFTKQQKRIC